MLRRLRQHRVPPIRPRTRLRTKPPHHHRRAQTPLHDLPPPPPPTTTNGGVDLRSTTPGGQVTFRRQLPTTDPRGQMRTPLCDAFAIEYPIFAFTPCRDVAAAVSKTGGLRRLMA